MNQAIRQKTKADQQVEEALNKRLSFVLDAGAGSGKTSSLVSALRLLIEGPIGETLAKSGQKVACITFTNVAKNEIIERTGNNPVIQTSTIHDFLWDVIKPHQPALKRALVAHNAALKPDSKRRRDTKELEDALKNVNVLYQDRGPEFLEGRIFHDDLLEIALLLFQSNPLMAKIAAAKFPFILVDEYQDTNIAVVRILVEHVLPANKDKVVVGFFGDKMQNIYDTGVGEIPTALKAGLTYIPKEENYRCSLAVIELLNKVRTDIKQIPAGKNHKGSAVFIRLSAESGDVLAKAREFVGGKLGWDLSLGSQKDLFLTHSLIAKRAGYDALLEAYKDRGQFSRDQLLKGEDAQIKFFRSVSEPLLAAWQQQNVGLVLSIIRENDFKLDDVKGKSRAKKSLDKFVEIAKSGSVAEILSHLDQTRLVRLPDDLKAALEAKPDDKSEAVNPEAAAREVADRKFFAGLLALSYHQISAFCRFLEEHTPFSTQHGVKGTEYDTVFVILDDKGARWYSYSFDKYFSGEDAAGDKQDRAKRTRNLFYVCCSRSRNNLAVIDLGSASGKKDAQVKALFGIGNCFL